MKTLNFITTSLFLFFFLGATAQVDKEIVNDLKQASTIYIVTVDDGSISQEANKALDETVRSTWKFTKAQFVTKTLSEMKNANSNNPCVYLINDVHAVAYYSNMTSLVSKDFSFLGIGYYRDEKFLEEDKFRTLLLPRNPSATDVVYAVRLITQGVAYTTKYPDEKAPVTAGTPVPHYRLVKETKGQLAKKTLLIDKTQLSSKLDEAAIKENYSYPFKIVDAAEIETAIKNRDPKYAYVQAAPYVIVPSNGGPLLVSAHHIISTDKGELLSYSKMMNVSLTWKADDLKIVKINLKNYIRNSEGKGDD
ncbi:MAG: hypothetical protein U0V74_17000 [Chitinophagales bacterium]